MKKLLNLQGEAKNNNLLSYFAKFLSSHLEFSDGTLQFRAFLAERGKQARFTYERARKRLASRLRVYVHLSRVKDAGGQEGICANFQQIVDGQDFDFAPKLPQNRGFQLQMD